MQKRRKFPKDFDDGRRKHFYAFGPFRVDPVKRILLRSGEPVPLTPKVFDILLVLVENHGEVLVKEELMQSVWPDTVVEEGNLNRNISMRRALGESPADHQYIATVPGRGYRFVADVQKLLNENARTSGREPIESVAVLPFQNLSGDPRQEYFADGLTEALLTELAQMHALRVGELRSCATKKPASFCPKSLGSSTWMACWRDRCYARMGACASRRSSSGHRRTNTCGPRPTKVSPTTSLACNAGLRQPLCARFETTTVGAAIPSAAAPRRAATIGIRAEIGLSRT